MRARTAGPCTNGARPVIGLAVMATLLMGAGQPPAHPQNAAAASALVSQGQIPTDLVGAWELQVDAQKFKLRDEFSIEIKFADGSDGLPEALVAYFAGDPRRPSGICRSQLDLVSATPDRMFFEETLNYKSSRNVRCPVWGRVSIQRTDEGFLLEWWGTGRREKAARMAAVATRLKGGQECRMVGASTNSDGEIWCRDAQGNWSAKRT